MFRHALVAHLACVSIGSWASAGDVLYVDGAMGPPDGDGESWATAYDTLEEALDHAWLGGVDEIRVAAATYVPPGPARSSTFALPSDVELQGGYMPGGSSFRLPWYFRTVLSGDIGEDGDPSNDAYHVVTAFDVAGAVLDGFIVKQGRADGADEDAWGGGVLVANAEVTIRLCEIKQNTATLGAGVMIFRYFDVNRSADVVIEDSEVIENTAASGGGVYVYGPYEYASVTIRRSRISDNEAAQGGGVYAGYYGQYRIEDSYITGNVANRGGGLLAHEDSNPSTSSPHISATSFVGNEATDGGAIHTSARVAPNMWNCVFSANVATEYGGAIYTIEHNDPVSMKNCSFSRNEAGFGGGAISVWTISKIELYNSIVWGNRPEYDQVLVTKVAADVQSSCIEHLLDYDWGEKAEDNGSFDADPEFADPDEHDLTITSRSSSCQAGDNDLVPVTMTTDRDGNQRIARAPFFWSEAIVDCGAYEVRPTALRPDLIIRLGEGGPGGLWDWAPPYAAGHVEVAGLPRATLWEALGDGVWSELAMPDFGRGSELVSDGGQIGDEIFVGGIVRDPGDRWRAAIWERVGEQWVLVVLPQAAATSSFLTDAVHLLDGTRRAVGRAHVGGDQWAALWSREPAGTDGSEWQLSLLPHLPGGSESQALGIIDTEIIELGVIVGYGHDAEGIRRPVRWRWTGQAYEALVLPPLPGGGPWGVANEIAHAGDGTLLALGQARGPGAEILPVRWTLVDGQWRPEALATQGVDLERLSPRAIMTCYAPGAIVGWGLVEGGDQRAVLWESAAEGGRVHDLTELLGGDATGEIVREAVAIDAEGRVAMNVTAPGDPHGPLSPALLWPSDANPCPQDLDGSGAVDVGDITAVLVAWGPCESCPEDFDGNGVVDLADLIDVLANWGPCV